MKIENAGQEELFVSVVIITYNSSKHVIETLESVREQTYHNIELIISDDFSSDDTVQLCRQWVDQNKEFFRRVKLLASEKNLGIPGNCNKGLKCAKGKWIKLLAGDDLLLPQCIEENIEYIKDHPEKIIFSIAEFFDETNSEKLKKINENQSNFIPAFYELDAQSQFLHLLIKSYPMNPPTIFFDRRTFEKLGGFDIEYVNEDFPFYLKATKAGYRLGFFPSPTVKYRVHTNSISFNHNRELAISEWKKLKMRNTIKKYITPSLFLKHPFVVIEFYNHYFFNELILLTGNKKRTESRLKFLRLLSPLFIRKKIREVIK